MPTGEVPPQPPIGFSAMTTSGVGTLPTKGQGLGGLWTGEKGSQLDGKSQQGGDASPSPASLCPVPRQSPFPAHTAHERLGERRM